MGGTRCRLLDCDAERRTTLILDCDAERRTTMGQSRRAVRSAPRVIASTGPWTFCIEADPRIAARTATTRRNPTPEETVVASRFPAIFVTVDGNCLGPAFGLRPRGGDDVALENTLCCRGNGTVPFGRKVTGRFFGRRAFARRDGETGRKMSQSPAASERLPLPKQDASLTRIGILHSRLSAAHVSIRIYSLASAAFLHFHQERQSWPVGTVPVRPSGWAGLWY